MNPKRYCRPRAKNALRIYLTAQRFLTIKRSVFSVSCNQYKKSLNEETLKKTSRYMNKPHKREKVAKRTNERVAVMAQISLQTSKRFENS